MVKHIVCFKLTDGSEENCKKAQEVLLSMKGNVPTAKAIEVHVDALHSARSYDIILEVIVENWEKLDEYQNDSYHCDVVKKHMHSVAANSIALDFEL